MNAHCSSAKGRAPIAHGAVAHERLIPLIKRAKSGAIWIHGPAGFGKSTLAAQFVRGRAEPHLWYRVDAGDADFASLLAGVGQALRAFFKIPRESLPLLAPLLAGSHQCAAGFFWRSVASHLPPRTVIVFDQVDKVPIGSNGLIGLAAACEELPDEISILFTSRAEPPPEFARAVVNERLKSIGPDDLRFSKAETLAFLAQRSCPTDDATVDAVFTSTQGWPAAVALLAHPGIDLISLTVDSVTHVCTLRKYLEAEVMREFPERFQDDLAYAAITETISDASARHLTGSDSILTKLGAMAEQQFLVLRLEGERPEYQLHPILRGFLLAKLKQKLPADKFFAMLLGTAHFLRGRDALAEAVALMHKAGAVEDICNTIEACGQRLIERGQIATLQSWLALVPEASRAPRPWLAYWDASSRMMVDPAQAKELMATAYRHFESPLHPIGRALSWAGSVEAIFTEYASLSELDSWLDCFDAEVAPLVDSLPSAVAAKVALARFTALIFRRPAASILIDARAAVTRFLQGRPSPTLAGAARAQLFIHALWSGDVTGAELHLDAIKELSRQPHSAPSARLFAQVGTLAYGLFAGELAACDARAESCIRLACEIGVHVWDPIIWGHRVCALIGQGRFAEAAGHMPRWRASLKCELHHQMSRYLAVSAFLAAKRKEAQRARDYCTQALESANRGGAPTFRATTALTVAATLFELDSNHRDTDELVQSALTFSQNTNPLLHWVALLMRAGIAARRGSEAAALSYSERAFKLGAERSYWHFAFWPRDLVTDACEVAVRHHIEPEYLVKLIRRNDLHPPTTGYQFDGWPWRVKVRTLGRFALSVDDEVRIFNGKTQKMPVRLLQALIALGGREVSERRLCDALWPEAEGDAASDSLGVTLHRLRQWLKVDCIRRSDGRLSLDSQVAWVDVWGFERVLKSSGAARRLAASDLRSLYQGAFLQELDDAPWALPLRERLRDKLIAFVSCESHRLIGDQKYHEAESLLLMGLEVDDLVEDFYRSLMQCHAARGDVSAALHTYGRCECVLASRLAIRPSTSTAALRTALMPRGRLAVVDLLPDETHQFDRQMESVNLRN